MNRPGDRVSEQWARWRAATDLGEYESRFARSDSHGEADLIASFAPRSVLDAGCGTGRLGVELDRRGIEVVGVDLDDDLLSLAQAKAPSVRWEHADLATLALERSFDVVAMAGNVLLFCRDSQRSEVVASCARHLGVDGLLIAGFSLRVGNPELTVASYDRLCSNSGLVLVDRWSTWQRAPWPGSDYAVSVHRRMPSGC